MSAPGRLCAGVQPWNWAGQILSLCCYVTWETFPLTLSANGCWVGGVMSSQTSRLRIALRILAIGTSARSDFSEGGTESDPGLVVFKTSFNRLGKRD